MLFSAGFQSELTKVLIVGALLATILPADKSDFMKSDG